MSFSFSQTVFWTLFLSVDRKLTKRKFERLVFLFGTIHSTKTLSLSLSLYMHNPLPEGRNGPPLTSISADEFFRKNLFLCSGDQLRLRFMLHKMLMTSQKLKWHWKQSSLFGFPMRLSYGFPFKEAAFIGKCL